ncbi:ribosome assembly RNA-binding protein YhbY [Pseudaeromonas paramecii]|uniref:Ribosome assembly RNA-binding protein YhbY n=1 Tax=Pseudaeromonas paramecii TaxID=2138166 RepID=A0ABP8Q2N8_9GAMM
MTLTTKQKQYLKGLAHSLKPVVLLGQHGLTEGVLAEIDAALAHHELIKVKVSAPDRETKQLINAAIVRETGANQVQAMGNMLTLYRPAQEPKLVLPKK